jgi:hypothetical protein
MFADLYVDGTLQPLPDECPDRVALEFDSPCAYRCRVCGDELNETTEGLCTDSGEYVCPDYDPSLRPDADSEPDCADGPHDAERVPLSWCNSVAVSADEAEDSVTVSISVGDPRGAFTFTIRRVPDDVDGDLAGQLILQVPHGGMASPHMPLTELHDGTYVVGNAYLIRLAAAHERV